VAAMFVNGSRRNEQTILVSDWLISKKSPLKPLIQLNRNLVGSIYGRFPIKIVGASHQISTHFGQAVSEKIFRNRPI
jgi:hypothetical protein